MIDSHGHIYMEQFSQDRHQVISRAVEAGVTQLLQVGCSLEESRTVLALAERMPGIYASVGVHPHDASSLDEPVLLALAELAKHPKVVALGEMGLDFYYDNSPREQQIAAFEAQLARVDQLDLPVVIHTRDAEEETRQILARYPVPRGGQVHCFTGSMDLVESLLEMGYHIGFTGIITFKNAAALREVVARVPMERLLIETDSPYLAPVPHRGKRNEPAFVSQVAKAVAQIKQLDLAEVVAQTTANFYALYGRDGFEWESLTVPHDRA